MSISVYKHGQMPKIALKDSVPLHKDFGGWLRHEECARLQGDHKGNPSTVVYFLCAKETELSKIVCMAPVSISPYLKNLPFRQRSMKLERFAEMIRTSTDDDLNGYLNTFLWSLNLNSTKKLLANLDTEGHDIVCDFTLDDIAMLISLFEFNTSKVTHKYDEFDFYSRF